MRVDVGTVDGDRMAVAVGRFEAEGVEQALEHGVQAARADVFLAVVHLRGDVGDAFDRVLRERKCRELMIEGVTIERPETVTIDMRVRVGVAKS